MCVIHVHVMAFYCHQIRRKPSYLDVKIRSRTENGTPSNISPPRAHSPANNKPYVNVVDDDRSSDQLSVYKWYVVLPLLCAQHVILYAPTLILNLLVPEIVVHKVKNFCKLERS